MIACVSSPPDAAPVSNRHIARSRAWHGHGVWAPWLSAFSDRRFKVPLCAAIQFSKCAEGAGHGVSGRPSHISLVIIRAFVNRDLQSLFRCTNEAICRDCLLYIITFVPTSVSACLTPSAFSCILPVWKYQGLSHNRNS